MSNRKFVLILFTLGLGLFLLGLGVGKSLESPRNQTLGEESVSQAPNASPEAIQQLENEGNLYKVLKVIDGDTVDLEINGKKETVRLIGIDAPESRECFGSAATNKARELLGLKLVELEQDSSQGERDRYGRLLRYIFVDGINFQELMIREGYAKEYTYSKPYKYQTLFKNAQTEAQNQKRGLWADGACSSSKNELKSPENAQYQVQGSYTCDCSKLCSQIETCDEAYYQLNQCGCSRRDSDKDGVPCESLCR